MSRERVGFNALKSVAMDGSIYTESEDESGDLVQRMADTVRMMADVPRMPTEPIRLTRRQYEAIRAEAKAPADPAWMGVPVEFIDDPPPSYRDAIRTGVERKQR